MSKKRDLIEPDFQTYISIYYGKSKLSPRFLIEVRRAFYAGFAAGVASISEIADGDETEEDTNLAIDAFMNGLNEDVKSAFASHPSDFPITNNPN